MKRRAREGREADASTALADAACRATVRRPSTRRVYCRVRVADAQRLIEPHPQHGAGRQLDVFALGRRDDAAAADQDAGDRALHAAENAADDAADRRAGADLPGVFL